MEDTEVDFAMKYAEERKLCLQLETRLLTTQYSLQAISNACMELLNLIAEGKTNKIGPSLAKLSQWCPEAQCIMGLNLLAMPGNRMPGMEEFALEEFEAFSDVPEEAQNKALKAMEAAEQSVFAEWATYGKMPPQELVRRFIFKMKTKTERSLQKKKLARHD